MLLDVNWLSEFISYFKLHVYSEWTFLIFILIPMLIDKTLGIINAVINKKFEFNKLWNILDKLVLYLGILIIIKALSSFEPVDFNVFKWINIIAIVFIILKELKSIILKIKRLYEYFIAKNMIKQKLKESV